MHPYTLIFLHIPKTAGTSLHLVLKFKYQSGQSFIVDNERPIASIKEGLQEMSERKLRKLKIIRGHLYYGVHQYLKTSYKYFTFLRDPVKRVISLYNQLLDKPGTLIYQKISQEGLSLKSLIKKGYYHEIDNDMTKRIAGIGNLQYGQYGEEIFEKAINNLENDFLLVGLQEYYLESLLILQNMLGWWVKPYVLSLNQSKKKNTFISDVDEETISLIQEYNQLDLKLYNYCLSKFKSELIKHPRLEKELITFKKQNEVFESFAIKYLQLKKMFNPYM